MTTHQPASKHKVSYLPDAFYTPLLSDLAKARKPSPIHSLIPLERTPGLISLLAGKPNPTTFPFTSLSFTALPPSATATHPQAHHHHLDGADLAQALQYCDTPGIGQLLEWAVGLQTFIHGRRKGEGWGLSVGSGSQDLIFKAVYALLNPGEAVLVESPVYAGVLPIFKDLKCEMIEVETDARGIKSSNLRRILEGWPVEKAKPKALYTVPYGCNPTGMSATLERRKEVLALAKEHGFIILEDDPYFYLYYGTAPRCPSYFALELEEEEVGRVVRFDSLSKVLSSGLRIGFVSGPEVIVKAIDMHTAIANVQTASLTQVIAFKLLDAWGYDGFRAHTERVSGFYKEKRDVFERGMVKYLGGLTEWSRPEAGLFFWFKFLLEDDGCGGEGDSEVLIRTRAFEKGVLALPGMVFWPHGRRTAYVRAAFSVVGEEEVEVGLQRLRDVVLDYRRERMGAGRLEAKL